MVGTRVKLKRFINPEYRPAALGRLDRRTWQARLLRDTKRELLTYLGVKATPMQLFLIEQIAELRLRLALFNRKVNEHGQMSRHDSRTYLAWNNSYRLLLRELGLEEHASGREPSLDTVLADMGGAKGGKMARRPSLVLPQAL